VRQLDETEKHNETHFKQLQEKLRAVHERDDSLLRNQTIKTTAPC
jgi:hypothetical protein